MLLGCDTKLGNDDHGLRESQWARPLAQDAEVAGVGRVRRAFLRFVLGPWVVSKSLDCNPQRRQSRLVDEHHGAGAMAGQQAPKLMDGCLQARATRGVNPVTKAWAI